MIRRRLSLSKVYLVSAIYKLIVGVEVYLAATAA